MQIGTTKDQGLYNNPLAAVHPGALATGTLPQYNTKKNIYTNTMADEAHYNGKVIPVQVWKGHIVSATD